MTENPKPKRQEILETAIALTCGDRNEAYGPPERHHECAALLKAVFDRFDDGRGGPAHKNAMHLVFDKAARIACGTFREDNYIDGAAYFAIAAQVRTTQYEANAPETFGAPVPNKCTCGAWRLPKGQWKHRTDCPEFPWKTSDEPHGFAS